MRALFGKIAALSLLAVAAVFSAGATASAKYIVLGSTANEYTRGDVLELNLQLTLGENEIVRLMAPNGSTRELRGPNSWSIGDLPAANSAPVEAFKRAVAILTGALRYDRASLAARGVDAYLNGYGVEKGGKFCYVSGGRIEIRRRDASQAAVLTVTTRGFEPLTIEFKKGQRSQKVAARRVFVRDGAKYSFAFKPGPSFSVTARAVRAGALTDSRAASTFIEKGCDEQFKQFLDRPL